MKTNLTTFPVNSSSEIVQTKKVIQELKTEIKKQTNAQPLTETTLLASLLKKLREAHEVGLLAICKQIKSVVFENGFTIIDSDDDLSELETNTNYHKILSDFFSEYHLNFKLKEKEKEDNSAEILNEMLDGKLTIK